jgi:hypothetical protein
MATVSVSTQYDTFSEESHDSNPAVIELQYLLGADTDRLITLHAWAVGELNVPGQSLNAGIQCIILVPALKGQGQPRIVIDSAFNYPSSSVSFWSSCSTAVYLKGGQQLPAPIRVSCAGYGQQSNLLRIKTINVVSVVQFVTLQVS